MPLPKRVVTASSPHSRIFKHARTSTMMRMMMGGNNNNNNNQNQKNREEGCWRVEDNRWSKWAVLRSAILNFAKGGERGSF